MLPAAYQNNPKNGMYFSDCIKCENWRLIFTNKGNRVPTWPHTQFCAAGVGQKTRDPNTSGDWRRRLRRHQTARRWPSRGALDRQSSRVWFGSHLISQTMYIQACAYNHNLNWLSHSLTYLCANWRATPRPASRTNTQSVESLCVVICTRARACERTRMVSAFHKQTKCSEQYT